MVPQMANRDTVPGIYMHIAHYIHEKIWQHNSQNAQWKKEPSVYCCPLTSEHVHGTCNLTYIHRDTHRET